MGTALRRGVAGKFRQSVAGAGTVARG